MKRFLSRNPRLAELMAYAAMMVIMAVVIGATPKF